MLRLIRLPLLLLLLGLTLAGCEYDEPGHQGRQPGGEPNWGVIVVSDEVSPDSDAIPCGEVRSIHLSVSQAVPNCTGYNFQDLYQKAKALVDSRTAQIVCSASCSIKQSYYTHWSWNCAGGKATVNVKAKVRCLDAQAPLPANVGDGSNLNFAAAAVTNAAGESGPVVPPAPPIPPAPTKGEVEVINASSPATPFVVPCDQKILLSLTYRRRTSTGGPPPFGYESYVDEAKARARLLHNAFSCQTPCRKQPFRALYTSWDLAGADVVMVRVFFEVECKR